ncbi:efflux transporter outer membrane subunit [Pseudoduganella sp. FT93W]|uniref:Efflux transporter outer membrane subunit n=1 Tax=Duganella fentianensis TaxID=2692177 RepID=A0A845I333_9BURK|nr:efflux transporter outer membrane subunit [Duganella fentianensis]MYN47679.1 efflux transporter outer membrane subunit [Duganella fentianensis]
MINRPYTITGMLLVASLSGGCAVGPDFVRPSTAVMSSFVTAQKNGDSRQTQINGDFEQNLHEGNAVPTEWWTLFGSSALNELVAAAQTKNPDLQAAEAALRVAQENAAAQRGSYLPAVDLHVTPVRQSVARNLASPLSSNASLYTLHTAQLSISYAPDIFGATRRQVEATDAEKEVVRFQYEAARLTLTANLVVAAINAAALQAQLDSTIALVHDARQQLAAVQRQYELGQLGAAEVAAQETALAQTEATLPPLEKQIAQQHHLLAVLAGRFPSDTSLQHLTFDSLRLVKDLPLSVPAHLVEQRPDIRAAEAQLHAASAQIGIAKAARLPNISLTAALGSSALTPSTLFKSGTGFWSIGADLVQPLYKGGTLMHQQRAAEAAYDQAAAQYQGVVLTAFQNVADTLCALEADAKAARIASAAERAAKKSLMISRRQWELGMVAYPAVLIAQQAYHQAAITLIQTQAARYADTVALFQALGGGQLLATQ